MKKGVAKENEGCFGVPLAACAAVEEQGRKVLHTHVLIWTKDWKKLVEGLSQSKEQLRKKFEVQLVQ